jgi:hypothetical protein
LVEALAAQGLEGEMLLALLLKALTRVTITSPYPIDATPASDFFDRADAVQAIETANAVLGVLEKLDQPPYAEPHPQGES